jgi:spore coat polysaccharide biosynthesis protein SpsF
MAASDDMGGAPRVVPAGAPRVAPRGAGAPRVVALVQARMGSTRLPGKVLMDLGGRPLLAQLLARLGRARRIDDVVVATSDLERDDPVAALAEAEGVLAVRGDERDVLSRMLTAARAARADAVVRVTADCPLIDPAVVDAVVARLVDDPEGCDYASNILRRTYPRGLDTEALWTDALERIARLGTSPEAREHVTWFAYRERPDLFLLGSVEDGDPELANLDWSVDTETDLELVRRLWPLARDGASWRALAAASG